MLSVPHLLTQYSQATGMRPVFSEQDFRDACADRCADPTLRSLPVIRRIAAPGALSFTFGGDTQDDRILTRFLIDAFTAGVQISPDFEIDCINFTHRRDFLKETWTYDAVAVCFIVGFPKFRSLKTALKTYDPYQANHDAQDFGHAISAHHTVRLWHRRIAQSEAKLVMTYGSRDEIGTQDLQHKYTLMEVVGTTKSQSFFNSGYLVCPDFAEAYRKHPFKPFNPNTVLGHALQTRKLHGFFDPRLQDRLHSVFNQMIAFDLTDAASPKTAIRT